MSEYTTIYLRCKEIPLLKYKEHPSYEEYQKLSKEDLMKVNREIDEYNKQVTKSLGCKLFYLSTKACLMRFFISTKKRLIITKMLLLKIKKI